MGVSLRPLASAHPTKLHEDQPKTFKFSDISRLVTLLGFFEGVGRTGGVYEQLHTFMLTIQTLLINMGEETGNQGSELEGCLSLSGK